METTTPQGTPETAAPAGDVGPTFPPGTKLREFETIFLVRPDATEEQVDRLRERMRALVARDGGKVIKFTTWGRKKTQYAVQKQPRAVYVHMDYLGPGALVAEVERNLRMIDDVLRYQTVKLANETDANRPVEQDVKLAGDADQDRPPREERERRDDFASAERPGAEERETEEEDEESA